MSLLQINLGRPRHGRRSKQTVQIRYKCLDNTVWHNHLIEIKTFKIKIDVLNPQIIFSFTVKKTNYKIKIFNTYTV